MRAIIIEDKDTKDLLRRLELSKLHETHYFANLGQATVEEIKHQVHRVFHLEVVQWLQDQGADLR